MSEKNSWPAYVSMALLVMLVIGSFTWMSPKDVVIPTADEIASKVKVTSTVTTTTANLSGIETRIADIESTVSKDDKWKTEALALAEDEYSAKNYKAIFNVLTGIVDKEDISSVVVTDFRVTRTDADSKDAKVFQELKVRYEDENGDNKKVYLEVTTIIKDGEVEEQEIDFA